MNAKVVLGNEGISLVLYQMFQDLVGYAVWTLGFVVF